MDAFPCSYCANEEFVAPSKTLLLNHIRLVHSHDPGFNIQCSHPGCSRTFTNFRTYQNHILTHRDLLPQGNEENETCSIEPQSPVASSSSPLVEISRDDVKSFAAKWILKTRETRNLTRSAMQGIIEDTSSLMNFACSTLETKIRAKLSASNVDSEIISSLSEIFRGPIMKPFDGIASFYQQLQYCRQHFNLVVSYVSTLTLLNLLDM